MNTSSSSIVPEELEFLKRFEIPGHVTISHDLNFFSEKLCIKTAESSAEIYLYGAHVTAFQKKEEAPLLFMSQSTKVERDKMLHGGIPICFPWFGAHQGEKLSHGFARNSRWDLIKTAIDDSGTVAVHFSLPPATMIAAGWAPVKTELHVSIGKELSLELHVENTTDHDFVFEECFHTYFFVGDIKATRLHGLKGLHYLDKTEDLISKLEDSDHIPICKETNRIYLKAIGLETITEHSLQRLVEIKKENSRSTVVWNPWKEKALALPDFNDSDYLQMLCVESGNVAEEAITLAPGASFSMKLTLGSRNLI